MGIVSLPSQELIPKATKLIRAPTRRITLDIIGTTGFGQNFDSLHHPDNELSQSYNNIFQSNSAAARILQLIGMWVPHWILRRIPSKRNEMIRNSIGKIRGAAQKLLDQKRQKMEKGAAREDHDILSVALESGGFSDANLIDQAMTFLAAGHETTSSTIGWIAYHMSKHPEMQKRLRNEIRENLPALLDPTVPITSTDIDRLPYLHAVLNETLRLTPPVALTLRTAVRDTVIVDHAIPKGTIVTIVPWANNADKNLWGPDALEFNPERWMQPGTANSGGAQSNYAMNTFLHGPRSCIGQQFSKAETACIMAALFGSFELSFPKAGYELDVRGGITSKPKDMLVDMKSVDA
jgi:cytochrome P450